MNSDDGEDRLARFNQWLGGVARLRDGISVRQAQADVNVLARQLETEYPQFADHGFEVAAAVTINPAIRGSAAQRWDRGMFRRRRFLGRFSFDFVFRELDQTPRRLGR